MNRKILIVAISILGILLLIMGACTGETQSCPPCPSCPPCNAAEPAEPCPPCDLVEPAEPTPQGKAEVKIVDMNHKRDSIGSFIVVGLIENVGAGIARQVEVSCSAFGSDGRLVDVAMTYPDQTTLDPGQETAFTCYLDEISPVTDYKCMVIWH